MTRMNFAPLARAPAKPRGGSAMRFVVWTALLSALVFWITLQVLG